MLVLFASAAFGCVLVPSAELTIDDTLPALDAPQAPLVEVRNVHLGAEPKNGAATSCDDVGWITLGVEQPDSDDYLVGYRVEVVSGTMPDTMWLPEHPVLGPELGLHWSADPGEALSFTLAVIPVDEAGVEGAPTEVVIDESPAGGGGCSVAAGTVSGMWLPLVLLFRRRV